MKEITTTQREKLPFRKTKFGSKLFYTISSPFNLVMCIVLFVFSTSFIIALLWGLLTSFKGISDYNLNMMGFPKKFKFSNYVTAFSKLSYRVQDGAGSRDVMLFELTWNTILYATIPVFVDVFSHAIVGYAMAKYNFKFNGFINALVVFTMVFPIVNSIGAQITYLKMLGLYDSYAAYVYGKIQCVSMGLLIWRGIFKNIDSAYMEAAMIDGAGHFRTMFSIMFPLARTMFSITLVTNFIAAWNSYEAQLTTMPSMPNLALALFKFQFSTTQAISRIPYQMCAAMLVALPCLIVFICFQKYFIGSLSVGGLKG